MSDKSQGKGKPQTPNKSKRVSVQKLLSPARAEAMDALDRRLKSFPRSARKELMDKLGETLDMAPATVKALVYSGRGSLENLLAALLIAWDLDENALLSILRNLTHQIPQDASPSRREWEDLDLDEATRMQWLQAIKSFYGR